MRQFDGMDVFRAHMALDGAAKSALLEHWEDKNSSTRFHLRNCKEQFAKAAAYLGFELVEIKPDSTIRHIDEMLFNEVQ